jgi:hypothetical protein
LIFNRDEKFGFEVIAAVKAIRIIPKRTSARNLDSGREHLTAEFVPQLRVIEMTLNANDWT